MNPTQIMEFQPAKQSASGKMMPAKVKLADGRYCAIGKGIDFNQVQAGAMGNAEVQTTQNGQYTNHTLTSWVLTTPPGSVPQNFPTEDQKASGKVDNAVWDAKDRAMAMMASNKPAAEIVCALIEKGLCEGAAQASTMYDAFSKQGYEMTQLARMNRIATEADPFADQ